MPSVYRDRVMIIIMDSPGQLCNQLWSYSPLIAKAKEDKQTIYINGFYDYKNHFPNLSQHKFIRFINPKWSDCLESALRTFVKTDGVSAELPGRSSVVFSSWSLPQDTQRFIRNADFIREVFKIPNGLGFERQSTDVVIGMHVRRGDYKYWNNGKYYYTNNYYAAIAEALQSQLKGNIKFFIASNEPTDELLSKIPNSFSLNISAISDLQSLSMCDYIFGPPSTFSMWASFYGQVPCKFILPDDEVWSINDFEPIIAQNLFSSGKRLKFRQDRGFWIDQK